MKAIVANVLFGSIFGCLSWTSSAWANPPIVPPSQSDVSKTSMVSFKGAGSSNLTLMPQLINLIDFIFTVNQTEKLNLSIDREADIIFADRVRVQSLKPQKLALNNKPLTDRKAKTDLILGFQNTFWLGQNNSKYWGVTTIYNWGEDGKSYQPNLGSLNYIKQAPSLAVGTGRLTLSGGGKDNLTQDKNSSLEFEQFRGGIAYHHGIAEDITMGVGFVYEDLWIAFTQLTYDSDILPLKTTVSLLSQESGLDFRSNIRFTPAPNLVLNYYHDRQQDKVDARWQVVSGLILTAAKTEAENDQQDSLTTGVELSARNEYMSISAKAALDNERNVQWKLKYQIGSLQFIHKSNQDISKSEIDLDLLESNDLGFKCSAYIKYQTKLIKQEQEEFTVWGSKLESTAKIAPNQPQWSLNIGYGNSAYGKGLIASGAIGLKPNLSLKLSYQGIAANSDETKIKLQLGSP